MESFIEVSAAGLIRHIDLRVAQIDQRAKRDGAGLYDKQIKSRLEQLKTMAALIAADTEAVVNLSCADAQLVAVFSPEKLTNSLIRPKAKPVPMGDIVINVPNDANVDPVQLARNIRASFRKGR